MKETLLVTNIQRFSLHDGPGIRTTVFLKGCSLRCPWCCNPENIEGRIQSYIKDGVVNQYGRHLTVEQLYSQLKKDAPFYGAYDPQCESSLDRLPGGVTFSGGEALLQIESLIPLMERLAADRIHIAVETCLFIPAHLLDLAIRYIDIFYVDIKLLDQIKCKNLLGGEVNLYYQNLTKLLSAKKPIVFRIPVIGGYTDSWDNQEQVAELIHYAVESGNVLKVELLEGHNLGYSKYDSLYRVDKKYMPPQYTPVQNEVIMDYKRLIEKQIDEKVQVEICRI